MADLHEIVRFCDALLDPDSFGDSATNGLQVPGSTEVARVATGVSASAELFERAASIGAQLVLTHHGILWDSQTRAITPQQKRRLELLFRTDMSLVAYHLPLDAHREIGNNALLVEALGFRLEEEPFGLFRGNPTGAIGAREDGIAPPDLMRALERAFGHEPVAFLEGPPRIGRIAVVSGGGAFAFREAIAAGADAFVTGEPSEPAMADAMESGVHFVAAGHYWTETLGVKRLGEAIAREFAVEHAFIEIPNPV